MPATRPSVSENSGGLPDSATRASARRTHRRQKRGTPRCRRVPRGFSNIRDLGLTPAEPGSCLDQERVFRSSMARVAVGQTLNLIFLDELAPKLFLIRWRFVRHVENLVARAYVFFGIAVTVDAPVHVQRIFLVHERHQVYAAVAGRTSDALGDVDAVVEVNEVR